MTDTDKIRKRKNIKIPDGKPGNYFCYTDYKILGQVEVELEVVQPE